MRIGLVGRKCGMTRVFTEDGVSIPVTVVEATPNRVTQIKSDEVDGYSAIQVTTGEKKSSRVSKPKAGQFAKAGAEAGRGQWEFRTDGATEAFEVGTALTVERFTVGQFVDDQGGHFKLDLFVARNGARAACLGGRADLDDIATRKVGCADSGQNCGNFRAIAKECRETDGACALAFAVGGVAQLRAVVD